MDEAQIKADYERLQKIDNLRNQRREIFDKLETINRVAREGKSWEISVYTGPKDASGWDRDRSCNNYRFRLPVGVVQQCAIDDLRKIDRQIIALGATP